MTGSTEAATELVERATLLRTLRAIQSLGDCEHSTNQAVRQRLLEEQLQDLEGTKGRVASNRQVPHDLTRHVTPPNQHAPGAHTALFTAKAHPTILGRSHLHQPLATLVRPAHHVSHRFCALAKPFKDGHEFYFEKLNEILVTAIANKGGLVPDGFKVNLGPRTSHLDKLFWVGEDGIQGLRDLVNIHETH